MSSTNPFDPSQHPALLQDRPGDEPLEAPRSLVQELAEWMPSVAPEPAAPDEGDRSREELETAERAAGQIHGYATRRDLDDLRETVSRLRRHVDEVMARRGPVAIDDPAPAPAMPVEAPPRYVVRSSGGDGPALLLVGPPDGQAATDLARSLVGAGMAAHEVVWSEAAWGGSLDDLVHDLATALDDLARDIVPVGIGPGAIPLACLAASRDLPALAVVDAAFAFGVAAGHHVSGPDWLATIQRDDALMRGTLTVGARPVDLAAIACPVLNLVSDRPDARAEASRALGHLVASDDYAEHPFAAPGEAGPLVAAWLADRPWTGYAPGHHVSGNEVS